MSRPSGIALRARGTGRSPVSGGPTPGWATVTAHWEACHRDWEVMTGQPVVHAAAAPGEAAAGFAVAVRHRAFDQAFEGVGRDVLGALADLDHQMARAPGWGSCCPWRPTGDRRSASRPNRRPGGE